MALRQACCALFVVAGCAPAATQEANPIPPTPLADHHMHVPSPAAAALVGDVPSSTGGAAGRRTGRRRNPAGRRALGRVLVRKIANMLPWTTNISKGARGERLDHAAGQAFPARLVPFCSVNPLKGYAREEINRCATQLMVKGLKLHFNTSGVDLLSQRHAETVRRVFQAVNERRLAMVVHVRGDQISPCTDANMPKSSWTCYLRHLTSPSRSPTYGVARVFPMQRWRPMRRRCPTATLERRISTSTSQI